MTRRLALLALLAACGGKAAPAPAPAPPDVVTYTWDWSVPCKVPVASTMRMGKVGFSMRSWISVVPEDGGFRIVTSDVSDFELDDHGMLPPEIEEKALAMSTREDLYPVFHVGADGSFLRVESALSPKDVLDPAKVTPQVANLMGDPRLKQMGLDALKDLWDSWVGAWLDWDGEVNLDDAGLAHLHVEQNDAGDKIVAVMVDLLRSSGVDPATLPGELGASMKRTLSATVEPVGLRPHHATHASRMEVRIDDKVLLIQEMSRDDEFDWANAEGCGR